MERGGGASGMGSTVIVADLVGIYLAISSSNYTFFLRDLLFLVVYNKRTNSKTQEGERVKE